MPYSEAHILVIGDSNSDIPSSYSEAKSIATLLKAKGYSVVELYRGNATTKNILKGIYGADAIIYAGHGGYESGHYNMKGGVATPPFGLVGSNDFIWGIGDKMREGWNGKLFKAPIKQNIPVILLQSCFSSGWVDDKEVSNPAATVYNFARMFTSAGANYYATAWNGAGKEIINDFLNKGAKNFGDINNENYEKIVKSNVYNKTVVWRNTNGYAAFIGNWLAQFPKVSQTTKYNDSAAESWYYSDRTQNPFIQDLAVTQVIIPVNGVKGYKISILNTVKNLANVSPNGVYVDYYLKKSSTSPTIHIGQTFISSLNAMTSKTLNTPVTIPNNINIGNYYVLAYANTGRNSLDKNETNNYKFSSTKISIRNAYRDLIMTELSANLKGSKTLYLSNTIKNTGTLLTHSFCVNYYIKNKKTSQSKYVGQYYYNGLSGGKVKKQNITFNLPNKIVANNYYVTASVDAHKNVKESNETNNYRTGIIKTV
jgi:hypothetical protein